MIKILANDGISQAGIDALKTKGFIVTTEKVDQENLINIINKENYEVLLVRSATTVRKDLIDACSKLKIIGRGGAWLDTGSIEDFYKTSNFVSSVENRQGFKIACIEEIAFNNKWINKKDILNAIKFYGNCDYSKYLKNFISK